MKYKLLILVSIFWFSSFSVFGQENEIDEEYKKSLVEMFEVSGTANVYKTMITGMFDMFREQKTDVPQEAWDKLQIEFEASAINDLNKLLTPVYYKHLDLKDIKGVISFYKSPTGKKLVEKTPLIMQEAMIIGQDWGKSIGEKVMKEIKEKGL